MNLKYICFIINILLAVATIRGAAQPTQASQISILTMEAGSDIYELEGHAALRVVDSRIGDICIDWGVFDFDSPNFVYRFTAGQTDYTLACHPTQLLIHRANLRGRRVVENVLDLDSATITRVIELVSENIKPWNRQYRYNYVKDNCSTRVYQIIEKAVGDTITVTELPDYMPQKPTFRKLMTYFHRNYPWYQFGIDLALGSGIDRELNNRETLYAPMIMEIQLPAATINGKKLVKETRTLVYGRPGGLTAGPTPFYATPLFVAIIILLVSIILTIRDMKTKKTSRWFDTVLYTLFGVMGLILTFLIFVSVHEATSPNWLYLWLNPLCFIGATLIWLKSCKKVVFYWHATNFVLLITLIIIDFIGIQYLNISFYPLIVADMSRSIAYIYQNVNQSK